MEYEWGQSGFAKDTVSCYDKFTWPGTIKETYHRKLAKKYINK